MTSLAKKLLYIGHDWNHGHATVPEIAFYLLMYWYPVAFLAVAVGGFALMALDLVEWGHVALARLALAGLVWAVVVVGRNYSAVTYQHARMSRILLRAAATNDDIYYAYGGDMIPEEDPRQRPIEDDEEDAL